jgi:hypothetical protein
MMPKITLIWVGVGAAERADLRRLARHPFSCLGLVHKRAGQIKKAQARFGGQCLYLLFFASQNARFDLSMLSALHIDIYVLI